VYLPRFPKDARVLRVGPDAVRSRSPLADVVEVEDVWDNLAARNPKWIIVSEAWVWHYLKDPPKGERGRILPFAQVEQARDTAASGYFRALLRGDLGYRKARLCHFESSMWPTVRIHSSTGEDIWILERDG
jgi:hypothetical protein